MLCLETISSPFSMTKSPAYLLTCLLHSLTTERISDSKLRKPAAERISKSCQVLLTEVEFIRDLVATSLSTYL